MEFIFGEIFNTLFSKLGHLVLFIIRFGKINIDNKSGGEYYQHIAKIQKEESYIKLWNGYKFKGDRYYSKEFAAFIGFISLSGVAFIILLWILL